MYIKLVKERQCSSKKAARHMYIHYRLHLAESSYTVSPKLEVMDWEMVTHTYIPRVMMRNKTECMYIELSICFLVHDERSTIYTLSARLITSDRQDIT